MRHALLLFAALLVAAPTHGAEAPPVVASVRPIQAIAAAVMAGAGSPQLLLPGTAALHTHALRPSEARLLAKARVVFWIGPPLETSLGKPLAALAQKPHVVALIEAPGVELLRARIGGLWEHGAHAREADSAPADGHIWLDVRNAVAIANVMAESLAVVDPFNAERYWSNAEAFSRDAMALDKTLHVRFAPVREKPFLVFHDATQYFEARYRLAAMGSIGVMPDQPPGAQRLAAIQEKLRGVGAVCIFSEPQIEPRTVQMLVEGFGAKTGVLDPEGVTLQGGPNLYFNLMRGLADEFLRCLA